MNNAIVQKSVASSDDLAKINQYSRKELTADDVYVFTVTLCDNDIDRDYEKFSLSALQQMAELFVGKTGISDHSMRSSDQKARIFETWVEKQDGRFTQDGEQLYSLRAKAYMLNNESNKALIDDIDAGIKKEVSVSCSMSSAKCSICGTDKRKARCEHMNGRRYENKIAFTVLDDATDAYEFSFVAVPAQRNAGVTKSFVDNVSKTIEQKIAEGRNYRDCTSVKAVGDNNKFDIEGYATTFEKITQIYADDNYELYEIIDRNAFSNTDMSDVIMQYEHQGRVFARKSNNTLSLNIDDTGLMVNADLSGTQLGREIFEEIKGEYSNGIEFGFKTDDVSITSEKSDNGRTIVVRRINSISKIYDVSVVSKSANDAATISAKNLFDGVIEQIQQEQQAAEKEMASAQARINLKLKFMEV